MRSKARAWLPGMAVLAVSVGAVPAWGAVMTHGLGAGQKAPTQAQIKRFCVSYRKWSKDERAQYREQYEKYCKERSLSPESTFSQPIQPLIPQENPGQNEGQNPNPNQGQQQQPAQQQTPQQPNPQPSKPEQAGQPEQPQQPEQQPSRPQVPEQPEQPHVVQPQAPKAKVDLVGRIELQGATAHRAGESQALRVTVKNRGPDTVRTAGLWARVFLSDRDVSRRRTGSGFGGSTSLPGGRVRVPGVPGPGRSRQALSQVTLPAVDKGRYWWCVQVDTRQAVAETDEGNNTACAHKVVALGGEPDQGLSALFGAKVATLKAGKGEPGTRESDSGPSAERATAGLLRQSELDRLADRLADSGTVSYVIETGRRGEELSRERMRGLLLMRSPENLTPAQDNYYGDGRGNLVEFGELPADGAPSYALTLFAGGGTALVVDVDHDGVVDAGASEGLKDRFGFLARPGMGRIIDCMHEAVDQGAGSAGSLPGCLGGEEQSGSGGSGGAGGGASGGAPGGQLGSAISPQCGDDDKGIGSPGRFAQDTGDSEEKTPEEKFRDEAAASRSFAKAWKQAAEEADTEGHHELARDLWRDYAAYKRLAHLAKKAADDFEYFRALNYNEYASEDDKDAAALRAQTSAGDYYTALRRMQKHGHEMPAPGPGGMPATAGNDPRCGEPSEWNRLLTKTCVNNMADCLKRMSDPVYAATDGQCHAGKGPADNPDVECESDDSGGDCIANGGTPQDCVEEQAGGGQSGAARGENDELFNKRGGSLTYGAMDVSSFGATLAAMCREAGGILCGERRPAAAAAAER